MIQEDQVLGQEDSWVLWKSGCGYKKNWQVPRNSEAGGNWTGRCLTLQVEGPRATLILETSTSCKAVKAAGVRVRSLQKGGDSVPQGRHGGPCTVTRGV